MRLLRFARNDNVTILSAFVLVSSGKAGGFMIAAPSKGANRNLLKSKPSNRHSRMYLAGIHIL